MIYHNETMYLANDSLGTSFSYGNPAHVLGDASHSVRKILPISDNCCAENAAQFGYDNGQIGPPYRIFKMTKDKFAEITPAAQLTELRTIPPNARGDNSDDKAIASVMDKLEISFMAGDYSYAVEVMYGPIVEKMGGKENVLAAATNITAQGKQKQIIVLSWKAKKPYQYVRAKTRIYAIIPYESVMTVSGKKLRQQSYQLGIKTADSQWQFANGDNLSPDFYHEFFADFPKDIELPTVERSYE